MQRIIISKGQKISLVVLEKQDTDLLYAGMNNLETNLYLGNSKDIYHMEDIEKLYTEYTEENSSNYFSIINNESKKVIGICALKNIRDLSKQADTYIFIFDKTNHNKGYGAEVVQLLKKYGFEILGLNKITLSYIEGNEFAENLYQKQGFTEVGRFKQDFFLRGELRDQIYMETYKKDYT